MIEWLPLDGELAAGVAHATRIDEHKRVDGRPIYRRELVCGRLIPGYLSALLDEADLRGLRSARPRPRCLRCGDVVAQEGARPA